MRVSYNNRYASTENSKHVEIYIHSKIEAHESSSQYYSISHVSETAPETLAIHHFITILQTQTHSRGAITSIRSPAMCRKRTSTYQRCGCVITTPDICSAKLQASSAKAYENFDLCAGWWENEKAAVSGLVARRCQKHEAENAEARKLRKTDRAKFGYSMSSSEDEPAPKGKPGKKALGRKK